MREGSTAPELAVSQWFNTSEPLSLAGRKGQVVLLHAFQMLCPGCTAHGTARPRPSGRTRCSEGWACK